MSDAPPLKICIYAFSSTALFFRGLVDACAQHRDAVEWSAICPQGHFRRVFKGAIPVERCWYLYGRFRAHYAAADAAQIQRALESGEGLIAALFKDKDGYRHLDKGEQLRRGAAIYASYRAFLERMRPDFVLFPDVEAVDGFVLLSLCAELGIGVLYFSGMRMLGAAYFAPDANETLPPYFGNYAPEDIAAARAAIARFDRHEANEAGGRYPAASPPKPSWFRRVVVSEYLRWRYERRHVGEENLKMRFTRNALGLMTRIRRRRFEMTARGYFDACNDTASLPAKYLFFALHYTPESSINGLEPYYVDQSRVIDALLLSLPRGHRLVVKEHPAMYGMRPHAFYRALRRRPGVVLVHPALDTRRLIAGAALVATVSGTIGLEAYLLDKPCMLFGRSFFAHLSHRAPAVSQLKPAIEEIIAQYRPSPPERKEIEIAKFLNVGADFVIGDPWFNPSVMAPQNVATAREYLWKHLTRLGERS